MRDFVESARHGLGRMLEDTWNGVVGGARQLSGRDFGATGTKFVCVSIPELALAPAPAPVRPARLKNLGFASMSAPPGRGLSADADAVDKDDVPPHELMGPTLALETAWTGKRTRGKYLTDPEDINALKDFLKTLPAEQREALEEICHKQILNSRRTDSGKPLYDAAVEMEKTIKDQDLGIGRPTMRQLPRWQQDMLIRPERLRPGAEKMQLRPWEEEKLSLELMGNGNVFSPAPIFGMLFGGRRDFAYAIYAKSKEVPKVLGERWAGIEQDSVITNPEFYHDVIVNAPLIELTLMIIPSRDLPVAKAVERIKPAMEKSLSHWEPTEKDTKRLDDFVSMFDKPHLQSTSVIKPGPTLQQGSKLIFTCGPQGQTSVEAINAGKIKDQRMVPVHYVWNNKVTYSLFDAFMGKYALDLIGKQSVARGLTYIANGFSFQLSDNPNQVLVDDPSGLLETQLKVEDWRVKQENVPCSLSVFSFPALKNRTEASKTLLLDGISKRMLMR